MLKRDWICIHSRIWKVNPRAGERSGKNTEGQKTARLHMKTVLPNSCHFLPPFPCLCFGP